ncbi:hypothetical protein HF325_003618 [Metschnikowia pulcherrima]|uniref:Uncharacterized protein n=1 Tax=Metschnikowia pulcherrima TaxID=27326 RepID=A0A8H7LCC3_9ASCO|nr:hypothetical protein HF325_003618 [Metschnikowia pulcherrima]
MPKLVFLTNSRKVDRLLGHALSFWTLCLLNFAGAQSAAETDYELVGATRNDKNTGDVGKLVDSAKASDLENDKPDLAMNKVQNSKGEYGRAVMEAPKGGMVNEAHIVGNDEDLVVDGKTKKNSQEKLSPSKNQGFKASREGDSLRKNDVLNQISKNKETKDEGSQAADLGKLNQPLKKMGDTKKSSKIATDNSTNNNCPGHETHLISNLRSPRLIKQ